MPVKNQMTLSIDELEDLNFDFIVAIECGEVDDVSVQAQNLSVVGFECDGHTAFTSARMEYTRRFNSYQKNPSEPAIEQKFRVADRIFDLVCNATTIYAIDNERTDLLQEIDAAGRLPSYVYIGDEKKTTRSYARESSAVADQWFINNHDESREGQRAHVSDMGLFRPLVNLEINRLNEKCDAVKWVVSAPLTSAMISA